MSLDYELRTSINKMKDNSFKLAKERSIRYHAQKNYGCGQHGWHSASGKFTAYAKSLLHSLERAASGRSLHVNADKAEYMGFNKMVVLWNQWTSSPTSETVSHQPRQSSTREAKVWTAIDRLSVIWKSDPTNKILIRYCYMDALHGRYLNLWR